MTCLKQEPYDQKQSCNSKNGKMNLYFFINKARILLNIQKLNFRLSTFSLSFIQVIKINISIYLGTLCIILYSKYYSISEFQAIND